MVPPSATSKYPFLVEVAPVKAAVFPLLKKKPELVEIAKRIAGDFAGDFPCMYDDTAAIGKLYRRQDEIGTFYCITVDVQTLDDRKVTVRDRDTMLQDRVDLDSLKSYVADKLKSKA